ncbi:MAG: hypothetical protein OXI66_19495 [Boseongicola sp.]|nr:hypothetical protein [Boseongicola sp.]
MNRGLEALTHWISEVFGWIGWLLILYCMAFGVSDVFLRMS